MRTERFVIRSGSKLTANVVVLAKAGIICWFIPHRLPAFANTMLAAVIGL
jgi:hypothetical protein